MNEVVEMKQPGPMAIFRRELDSMEEQFKAALPAQIPVERFKRVVMTAIQNNPDLLGASRRSLWNSAMRAAQDGLLPDGREGAMVLFGKQAQFLAMVGGLRKKVRNSGDLATWDVYAVHEGDEFEYQLGDEPMIRHKPNLEKPGKLIAVYSIATLKSGEKSRDVMSISEVERIRLRSRAKDNGPWVTDYEEMAKKTVARRHSKVLPMSTDLDDLIRRDDELMDMREGFKQQAAATGGVSALDAFAAEPAEPESSEPPVTEEAEAGEGDDSKAPSPADAYARGQEDREKGKALRAVPPEWREAEFEPLASAWTDGWKSRDAVITAEAKLKGKKS